MPRGKVGAVSAEWPLALPERLDRTRSEGGPAKKAGSNVKAVRKRCTAAVARLCCQYRDGQNGNPGLVDSPGGDAKAAYQLAMLLKRRCGQFVAIVPRYAKSAATLLCLGAKEILMSGDAELGPLDIQIMEIDREERVSALDEVQSLDRLSAFAQQAVDRQMQLLMNRSGMKIRTLLPDVHSFVSNMVRPLFEKIDIVHYTQMSRLLKVAEGYAHRLLAPNYPPDVALFIARHLVHSYPEHGFLIAADEAKQIGLNVIDPSAELSNLMDQLVPHLSGMAAVGLLETS